MSHWNLPDAGSLSDDFVRRTSANPGTSVFAQNKKLGHAIVDSAA